MQRTAQLLHGMYKHRIIINVRSYFPRNSSFMLTVKNFSWKIRQEHFQDENLTKRTLSQIKILLAFFKKGVEALDELQNP